MEATDLIKVHPPVVHFAIALPVVLLVIDLYYRFKKNPARRTARPHHLPERSCDGRRYHLWYHSL